MLKNTSVDKIIKSKTIIHKVINLDSGFYMYNLDSNFIIFHKEGLQKEIEYNQILMSDKKIDDNIILNFINGIICYQQPSTLLETSYEINKMKCKEMNCELTLELIKQFRFTRNEKYVKGQWIKTGIITE